MISVFKSTRTHRLQIVNWRVPRSRRARKSSCKDGLSNVCIGTKYLVDSEILEQQRHDYLYALLTAC